MANLDLEEERTEGNAVSAMPQLIIVLEAIVRTLAKKSQFFSFLKRVVVMKMDKGRVKEEKEGYWDVGESESGLLLVKHLLV